MDNETNPTVERDPGEYEPVPGETYYGGEDEMLELYGF